MAYFIDLFSPETYEAFARFSRDVSGFRLRHKKRPSPFQSRTMAAQSMRRPSPGGRDAGVNPGPGAHRQHWGAHGHAHLIPRADRTAILKEWKNEQNTLLERLPLNYDDTTLRTVEQIDVLWLRGRSIVRAFEVEHTTSVYSGILRMADLLALHPNMDIKLHIVAPVTKRDKVLQEIRRPVFSLLEKGPLADSCTYLSYDSLRELASQKHLAHLSDSVLDEYAEEAE
jgi:hypothetical protein